MKPVLDAKTHFCDSTLQLSLELQGSSLERNVLPGKLARTQVLSLHLLDLCLKAIEMDVLTGKTGTLVNES